MGLLKQSYRDFNGATRMKTRHVYHWFNIFNAEIFNNELPKSTKLFLRDNSTYSDLKKIEKGAVYMGFCEVYYDPKGLRKPHKFKIVLTDNYDEELKKTLLHEMIHLKTAITAGRDYYRIKNYYVLHDQEIFDLIGEVAFEKGLIDSPKLLSKFDELTKE